MNSYKILGHIPGTKIGDIVYPDSFSYCGENKKTVLKFSKDTLEQNPHMFSPHFITTTDGVDLYRDDLVHQVDIVSKTMCSFTLQYKSQLLNNCKYFSTEKRAMQYIESLSPKFKIGDIVVVLSSNTVGKIIKITPNHAKLDSEYSVEQYFSNLKLADSNEILRYYEKKGWVKGAKFKANNYIWTVNHLEIVDKDIYVIAHPYACRVEIEKCELLIEPFYEATPENKNTGYWTGHYFGDAATASITDAFVDLSKIRLKLLSQHERYIGASWEPDWTSDSVK